MHVADLAEVLVKLNDEHGNYKVEVSGPPGSKIGAVVVQSTHSINGTRWVEENRIILIGQSEG